MPRVSKASKPKRWLRSEKYLNRETSWLEFNKRVLEEAANPGNPLLERLRFLAIFESNLDEFYMVRVSGLIEQAEANVETLSPDGLTPQDQLKLIANTASSLRREAAMLTAKLLAMLPNAGIHPTTCAELEPRKRAKLVRWFKDAVFPICTPLVLHPAPSVPFISNRSLNLVVELEDDKGECKLARVKIPTLLERIVWVGNTGRFILIEDLIRSQLGQLFSGVHVRGAHLFRVIRDADVEIRELEAGDLIETVRQSLRLRRFGDPVLLEVEATMPPSVRKALLNLLELDEIDCFEVSGLIGMDALAELASLDLPHLKWPSFQGHVPEGLSDLPGIAAKVAQGELLLHHPFDSFDIVQQLVNSAATDPTVIGIKQTLYRVGSRSSIVLSLTDAAEAGKQVAAVVELKARFDEDNNIAWARALERSGAHVAYGLPNLKIHAKLCLVVRRSGKGIRSLVHIGTGNYNPTTARAYTDIGLITDDPEIVQDVAELFNFLTGFSRQVKYRKLLVAPIGYREGLLSRIERELRFAKKGKPAKIIMKLNALVDPEMIDALYEASCAGVQVKLIVRGVCCLRPGFPGLSENITVVSIVGRFLEHSRVYAFHRGGIPEILIGSGDLMSRNLDRRIEVAVPVESEASKEYLLNCLETYLTDNTNCWQLRPDGSYSRRRARSGHRRTAQLVLMGMPACSAKS